MGMGTAEAAKGEARHGGGASTGAEGARFERGVDSGFQGVVSDRRPEANRALDGARPVQPEGPKRSAVGGSKGGDRAAGDAADIRTKRAARADTVRQRLPVWIERKHGAESIERLVDEAWNCGGFHGSRAPGTEWWA